MSAAWRWSASVVRWSADHWSSILTSLSVIGLGNGFMFVGILAKLNRLQQKLDILRQTIRLVLPLSTLVLPLRLPKDYSFSLSFWAKALLE
jgi:hypothetical protein